MPIKKERESMAHQILIGYNQHLAEEVAKKQGLLVHNSTEMDYETVRVTFDRFWDYANEDEVLLVRAFGFYQRLFGIFLKALESPDLKGSIWFYDTPISKYPFTLRSRCNLVVLQEDAKTDWWRQELSGRQLLGFYPKIMQISHYDFETSIEMMNNLEGFVDLMFTLETSTEFNLYIKGVDRVNIYYYHLFMEWLDKSSFFTDRHLQLCPFLRTSRFIKMFSSISNWYLPQDTIAHELFLFMFAFKMVLK